MPIDKEACTSLAQKITIGSLGRLAEGHQILQKLFRYRRGNPHRLAARRMPERQLPRVQEHPLEAFARENAIPREVAVFVVARERVTDVCKMHANLVRSPGLQFGFE